MLKLVDNGVLKSPAFGRAGPSPAPATRFIPASSKGKTQHFGCCYGGSTPSAGAKFMMELIHLNSDWAKVVLVVGVAWAIAYAAARDKGW